jgi:hypothetical protein
MNLSSGKIEHALEVETGLKLQTRETGRGETGLTGLPENEIY